MPVYKNINGKLVLYSGSAHTMSNDKLGIGKPDGTTIIVDDKGTFSAVFPSTLPANGGNSDTVNGHAVESDVPENAKFTDTTYEKATSSVDGLMSKEDKKTVDELTNSQGQNLISYPYYDSTKTLNGITWTVNSDGTVTADGTATSESAFNIVNPYTSEARKSLQLNHQYVLSDGTSNKVTTYTQFVRYSKSDKTWNYAVSSRIGYNVWTASDDNLLEYGIRLIVTKGATVNNVVFKPMLEEGSIAHAYQPTTISNVTLKNKTNPATTLSVGIVKPDGSTITVDEDGTIHGQNVASSQGQNLTPYPYANGTTIRTQYGITYVVNDDGSVTANGTKTDSTVSQFYFGLHTNGDKLEAGKTYTLSGCPSGGSNSTFRLRILFYESMDVSSATSKATFCDYGNGVTFVVPDDAIYYNFMIDVSGGSTKVENLVFKPMLELGSISHAYQNAALSNVTNNIAIKNAQGQNLIPYPYSTSNNYTTNGLTFTIDDVDGAIIINGTATANGNYMVAHNKRIKFTHGGNYTLSGCPKGGSSSTYYLLLEGEVGTVYKKNFTTEYGSGSTVNISESDINAYTIRVCFTFKSGTTFNNVKMYPMLEEGTVAHAYQSTTLSNATLKNKSTAYVTCDAERSVADKVVALDGFILTVGSTVMVKFTNTTSTTNPTSGNLTLNVNGTGAKPIGYFRNGSKATFTYVNGWSFYNNITHIFTYDGTYWLCMDWNPDNNTTYSNFVKSGTGAKAGLVPAPSTTAGTSKYLREDGTWTAPPSFSPTTYNVTVTASSWSGSAAPYSATISIAKATTTNVIEVAASSSATSAQITAMANAMICNGTQAAGSITLKAYGEKPTIDLPLTVVVFG